MVKTSRRTVRSSRLLYLNKPESITVKNNKNGISISILKKNRLLKVNRVQDKWLVKDRWWKSNPISRYYYKLELDTGDILVIFKDLLTDKWYKINWY
jgi:hypothetical protein